MARRLGWDLTCLGFSGECHLDPIAARAAEIGRRAVEMLDAAEKESPPRGRDGKARGDEPAAQPADGSQPPLVGELHRAVGGEVAGGGEQR